jgi:hypothetical protein
MREGLRAVGDNATRVATMVTLITSCQALPQPKHKPTTSESSAVVEVDQENLYRERSGRGVLQIEPISRAGEAAGTGRLALLLYPNSLTKDYTRAVFLPPTLEVALSVTGETTNKRLTTLLSRSESTEIQDLCYANLGEINLADENFLQMNYQRWRFNPPVWNGRELNLICDR